MPVVSAPASPTHEAGGNRFTSLATPSLGASETSVWRVEVAPGTSPVPHQVTREEIFVVTAGRARVRIGADRHEAGPGDAVIVPAHTEFELANGGDEPLRALCCLPAGGQALLPGGEPFTPPWAR
jgi:quercetin dioxygenase-like cupin family protein